MNSSFLVWFAEVDAVNLLVCFLQRLAKLDNVGGAEMLCMVNYGQLLEYLSYCYI